MDSVYLYNKYGSPISYDLWTHLRQLVNWVCENWRRKDEGIWEVRGGQQNFLYSKLMCWVAVDRGLRLADKRSFPIDVQLELVGCAVSDPNRTRFLVAFQVAQSLLRLNTPAINAIHNVERPIRV